MKQVTRLFSFLIFSLLPISGFAANAQTCNDTVERRANIQLQVLYSPASGSCFLSISPFKNSTLVYRNYLMTDEGLLMVFNSFGDGEEMDNTAAREFYFFPRVQANPTHVWNDLDRRLEVTHTNGDVFYFDYDSADIFRLGRGQVFVAPEIRKENKGGVEILEYQGLVLDVGFTVGHSPSAVAAGAVAFIDHKQQSCGLKVREVFIETGSQDMRFKYSDVDLVPFLKNRCPQLSYP